MADLLELEPQPTSRKRDKWLRIALVAGFSLSSISCGDDGKDNLRAESSLEAADTTRDTRVTSTTRPTSTTSSSALTSEATTTTWIPTTEAPAPPPAPTPTTVRVAPPPPPPPTVTSAPNPTQPPAQREALSGPTSFEVLGSRSFQCQTVPPSPDGMHQGYRACSIEARAQQTESRPEANRRVMTVFTNCGPGERPTQETLPDGTQTFWRCPSTSTVTETSPVDQVGPVSGYLQVETNEPQCWFAFSRIEEANGQGFWFPEQVSDTISNQICFTMDDNGNATFQ